MCPASLLVLEEERVPTEESLSFTEFCEAFSRLVAILVRKVSNIELSVLLLPYSGIEVADDKPVVTVRRFDDVVETIIEVCVFLVAGVECWGIYLDDSGSRFRCDVEFQDGQAMVDYSDVFNAWDEVRGDDEADASRPWLPPLPKVYTGTI